MLEIYIQEILIIYKINFLQYICVMIQFTYCGQCLLNLKNMTRVGCLILLPEQLACVVFSLKTCTVMASEMSDIAHVMSVCFQILHYISKCCHRFMDCFHLFSIIAINLQAQFFNFLLSAQEKITTIFTK